MFEYYYVQPVNGMDGNLLLLISFQNMFFSSFQEKLKVIGKVREFK